METVESWVIGAGERWSACGDTDRFVMGSSAILIVGGAIIAVATGRPAVFASGAVIAAVLVGVRCVTAPGVAGRAGGFLGVSDRAPPRGGGSPGPDADYTYGGGGLGAPIGRMVDTGPTRAFGGLPLRGDAQGFPLMHGIRDADVRTEPLDDRIQGTPSGPQTGRTVTGFW